MIFTPLKSCRWRMCATVVNRLAAGLAFAIVATGTGTVRAQDYPARPVTMIVPFAPGGPTDVAARIVAQRMSATLGQNILVSNLPGAGGGVGSIRVAQSGPDGYTLLMANMGTQVLARATSSNLGYDPIRDFAPVATIASSELILVGSPKLAANNVKELVALGKTRQGQITYATSSAGGPTHVAAELFGSMTGVKLQHVPYKGSGPAVNDLLGGHVDIGWTSPIAVIQLINAGKLKGIAISGDARAPTLPQVPTFTESGLPGFDMRFWYALLAPANTPRDILSKLSAEVAKIVVTPEIKEKLAGQGADPFVSNPDQFAAVIKADSARYEKVIKGANIKMPE